MNIPNKNNANIININYIQNYEQVQKEQQAANEENKEEAAEDKKDDDVKEAQFEEI